MTTLGQWFVDAIDWARSVVRPEWRERIYDAVGVVVVLLGSWGLVDDQVAATLAQMVLAMVALLFAMLHATSEVRIALYGLLGAAQAVAGLFAIGTDAQWAAVLAMAAAVLGTQVAAGNTPNVAALLKQLTPTAWGRVDAHPEYFTTRIDAAVAAELARVRPVLDSIFQDPVFQARQVFDTARRGGGLESLNAPPPRGVQQIQAERGGPPDPPARGADPYDTDD